VKEPETLEDVLMARQLEARRIAERKGHQIKSWNKDGHDWEGHCTNDGCSAHLLMSKTWRGSIAGATAYSETCPFRAEGEEE
jgi:hypothetical protein